MSATDLTSNERRTSQANDLGQQDQERMKAMSDSQLTSLHQTRTVTLSNTQFTIVSTASFIDANGQSSCSSNAEAYFKLSSTVTSVATGNNPGEGVTAETIITRPLAGTLVVPVQDQTSSPLSGAAVSVVGQNTGYASSATTDQNGCVAFAGLPTDGYTITATDIGYVDVNGNSSATETASVNQTNLTSAGTLILAPAGQIKVGFVTRGTSVIYDGQTSLSGHGPAPAGYALSYYGAGNGNNMTNFACMVYPASDCTGSGSPTTFNASTGVTSFTAGSLFPFYLNSTAQYTNNYQLWAGGCEQEQPLVPLTGTGFASVRPGMTASSTGVDAVVDEPAIDVAVKYGTSTYLPSHVEVIFSGKNSAGTAVNCIDTWHSVPMVGSETVGGTTYGTYPAPFASTVAKGTTGASNTGDKGTFQVCADYSNKHVTTSAASPYTTTSVNAPTMVGVIDVTSGVSGSCP